VANHLAASELEAAISEASFVIARTGYSTVMDLIKMQKKAVLIPTPGQTEQEYLGEHLNEHKLALCLPQEI
jgi:predicted glycosyltransferase